MAGMSQTLPTADEIRADIRARAAELHALRRLLRLAEAAEAARAASADRGRRQPTPPAAAEVQHAAS
jgi:hypothetical protein